MSSPECTLDAGAEDRETGATVWVFHYTDVDEMRAVIVRIQSLQMQEQAASGHLQYVEPESRVDRCCEFCFTGLTKKGKWYKPALATTTVLQNRSLRVPREEGWERLRSGAFPLFSKYAREIWTYLQFLITLAILLYSSITFALTDEDERTIVDILLLAFSIPSSLLSLLDLIITIYFQRCRLCRDCAHCTCLTVDGSNEQTGQDEGCCARCCKCCKNRYVDLARLLLSEAFIYPVVICAIFQFVLAIIRVESGINWKIGLKMAAFAGGILWKVLFVYVVRLVVLIRTTQAIQKARPEDGLGREAGMWFQMRFLLHVLGQMLSQVVMITSIAGKMYYENRRFTPSYNTTMNFTLDNASTLSDNTSMYYVNNFTFDNTSMNSTLGNTVHVSPHLWYMIVGAYVIPLVGIFTFAISNYFYLQQYPIGLYLDVLLKKPKEKLIEDTLKVIERVKGDYVDMRDTSFKTKCGYVLRSPTLSVLCLMYAATLCAFVACCLAEPTIVGPSVWAIFFLAGVGLVSIANIFVLLVAVVWTVILIVLLLTICLIVLYIFLSLADCGSNNNNRS